MVLLEVRLHALAMMLTQILRRYSTSYLLLSIAGAPLIAAQDDKLAKFGDTIEVLGQV